MNSFRLTDMQAVSPLARAVTGALQGADDVVGGLAGAGGHGAGALAACAALARSAEAAHLTKMRCMAVSSRFLFV